jgi:hypothetical protein
VKHAGKVRKIREYLIKYLSNKTTIFLSFYIYIFLLKITKLVFAGSSTPHGKMYGKWNLLENIDNEASPANVSLKW